MSTEQVQRWVISCLIAAVALFPLGAMAATISWLVDEDRHGDAVLITVAMAVLGMVAFVAARLVHRRSPLHVMVLLGTIPAIVCAIIFW